MSLTPAPVPMVAPGSTTAHRPTSSRGAASGSSVSSSCSSAAATSAGASTAAAVAATASLASTSTSTRKIQPGGGQLANTKQARSQAPGLESKKIYCFSYICI
ncbi:unnamed protein product [Protopolystoma xenopodis]|uniref:Uncharacterized protein n=1 Tax=Protopolystoma xenopodis TaxID=117903 RepID=A0A3S5AYJ1_9PLAT|nr:unnamed protein product [Protopolystoma xenopodis]